MHLFDGLQQTDYQDLLRALGRECDLAALQDLRIIETDSGLTLQFRYANSPDDGFHLFSYNDEALLALLQGAYALRGSGTEALEAHSALGLRYQQLLRTLGGAIDEAGLRNLRFIEQPGAVILQASAGLLRRGFRTYHLPEERLRDLVAAAMSGMPASLEAIEPWSPNRLGGDRDTP